MLHKYSLTVLCKDALTVTVLCVIAAASFPTQAFSLTTETVEGQQKNNSFVNSLSGEESNFLVAKKNKKDHDDDDHDDNDDRRHRRNRRDDNDRNYRNRRGEDSQGEYDGSSKRYQVRDWNCFFKLGRLATSNQQALVIQLDILDKPVTKYANVVYTVYARQNNRWVAFYNTQGARLIEQRGGKFSLQPEVIDYRNLELGNTNLSRSDLKFVTEIRYDSNSVRDQRIVFEDVWNYSSITEVSSINQLTTASNSITTTEPYYNNDNYNNNNNNNNNNDNYNNNNYRRKPQKEEKRYSSKAFRSKDWNGFFKLARLVNSNQRGLVIHLDILQKPVTRYANVLYTVYALQNNRWVKCYNSTGERLVQQRGGKFFLTPEVIEFNQLQVNNIDLSRSDLKFVTEIRYDSSSRREEKLVFEDVWNYSSISEINSISQIDVTTY
jgi:hypothetical protein